MNKALQMKMGAGGGQQTLFQAITAAGLTSNLQLCLDAGDAASYTSGTKWLDRSGNGYDFFLGTDGTTDAPTLNGGAGNRGAYWSGVTKYFTYDTTNEVWMQNLHKDNAAFTCIYIMYAAGTNPAAFGTSDGTVATNIGVSFYVASTSPPKIYVANGTGGAALEVNGDTTPAANAYHMVGVSLNEATGAGGGFLYTDGAYNQVSASDTFNSAYSSPSASSATYKMNVAALGNGGTPLSANERLGAIAIWSSALTKANLDSIFALQRARYGI